MKKIKTILILIFALSFSAIPIGIIPFVSAEKSVVLPEAYDIGPELRAMDLDPTSIEIDEIPTFETSGSSGMLRTSGVVGQTMYIYSQNWVTGGFFWEVYQCVFVGEDVEVWFSLTNLNWSAGDSRLTTHPITHTPAMLEQLVSEFENNIFPKDTDYFGDQDFLDGSGALMPGLAGLPEDHYYEETGRDMILVTNFRDDNYYDPEFPSFIIGFYWSLFEQWYGRNIINLDSAYWQYLLGPAGTEWIPGVFVEEDDEYAYESTTAHELQHLLHDDHLPGDPSFMDEACSMFAEQVCGYPIDYSKISWFLSTPDNSLTEWGDQTGYNTLADYGSSYLWALYLTDHFDWDFMGRYVQGLDEFGDPIPDLPLGPIARLSALLPGDEDFYSVYHDWRIANLIHSDSPGGGIYNYVSIDLDDYHPIRVQDVEGKKIRWTLGSSFPTITEPYTAEPDGLYLGDLELNPFSTDYVRFTDFKGLNMIQFDGDRVSDYPVEWVKFHEPNASLPINVLHDSWWSGPAYALKNVLLGGMVYVPDVENPTLNLLTYWDIEDYWDFGFVQVSTDFGDTWTSLENDYTTDMRDPNCHNNIKDNLPGLTSWTAYITGEWYTPIPISFDLSAYAGQVVLVGFRFMTDWGTEYDGWFIKEADIEGYSIMNILHPIAHEVDFMVTAVRIAADGTVSGVNDMWFKSDWSEKGLMLDYLHHDESLILIISAMHEYGTADYRFKGKSYHWNRWHKNYCKF
jgi:immune inhibitor A